MKIPSKTSWMSVLFELCTEFAAVLLIGALIAWRDPMVLLFNLVPGIFLVLFAVLIKEFIRTGSP